MQNHTCAVKLHQVKYGLWSSIMRIWTYNTMYIYNYIYIVGDTAIGIYSLVI